MNLQLRSRSSEYSRCDNILAVVSGFSVPILNEGLLLFLYLTNGRTSASLFLFSDIIRLGSQFQAIPSDQHVGSRVQDVGCDRFRTNKLACLASKTLTMDLGIEPRIFSWNDLRKLTRCHYASPPRWQYRGIEPTLDCAEDSNDSVSFQLYVQISLLIWEKYGVWSSWFNH